MGREIILTQGQKTVVDDDDYDRLMQMGSWYATIRKAASSNRNLGFYAARMSYKGGIKETIYMHNIIADAKTVTHINGDSLDNRKKNLCKTDVRLIRGQKIKQLSYKNSKFKGVRKTGRMKRWSARITWNGKQMTIGLYNTEVEAAMAYDQKAKECFGKFASLNFPSVNDRNFGMIGKRG